ncbi:MAG: SDR family oxidoreductase [Chloroflexi bacterium]|nr:SDR family oxidoreductase [Chloroflexota bacterium]
MPVLDRFRLDDRRAFVTGASRGIGRAIALALAEAGADVAVAARDEARLNALATEIEILGRRAHVVPLDLANLESIEPAIDAAANALGGLDLLVNNAGVTYRAGFGIEDPAEFDRMFDVNLGAVLFASQAARPHLAAAGGGVIVNIGSIAGTKGTGLYGASKQGVHALTRGFSREFASDSIRVVALAPGQVFTDMGARVRANPDEMNTLLHHTAQGRVADPSEIAAAVVYLASPAAGFVTGTTIAIDGGRDFFTRR